MLKKIIESDNLSRGDGGDRIPEYLRLWIILGISIIVFLTVIHRKMTYNTT